jgi:dihydrofolate reductase
MGKLVVTEFITVDGVVEDPGGAEGFERGGWAFQFDRGEAGNRFKMEELEAAEVQLLGRATYEGFARAWPDRAGDPFSDKMNSMPKYVASSHELAPPWENSHRIEGELGSAVQELKDGCSGDILVAGSARLVQGLTELGLVDEYRLMVYPVILGTGRRLFGDTGPARRLRMVGAEVAGECQIVTYVPASD